METIAAVVVASILGLDALMHLYWLTGRVWPAHDVRQLSQAVLNMDVPFTPRVLVPLVAVLTGGAVAVLGEAGLLGSWLPGWVATAGTIAVAAGAFARGGAGVVWALGIGATRDSVFHRLNLRAYTPACFVLCGAAVLVAVGGG
jgi:hypothetical protein